ncbi:conserved unknown protein [Ectocarpus siliculosus]|uniref:Uncharacterized protein n=1 Tax=Ectocarpus siliculosus TaxID=2880 RepID=D7FYR4_ECTSI|nr:conserved unknown protein [Ectocarpus siliculosus]|eukprot:CBJ32591.1 conserved unknown protein [Ectocarpus siliculosus]
MPATPGGGAGDNNSNSLGGGHGGGGASGAARGSSDRQQRPPDVGGGASSGMEVDGGGRGGGGGGGGGGGEGRGGEDGDEQGGGDNAAPSARQASGDGGAAAAGGPADGRRPRSCIFVVEGSADNVSSAKGITMGDVHGAVRPKTGPADGEETATATATATATPPAAVENLYTDMAFEEVVSLQLTGGDPVPSLVDAKDDGERRLRATSSGVTILNHPAASSAPEASNKRAKSGVWPMGGEAGAWTAAADSSSTPGLQQQQQQAGSTTTPVEALSSMSIDAGVGAPAAESVVAAAAPAAADGAAGAAAAEAAGAATTVPVPVPAEAPALTNDEWVARISPLVPSIPEGTHPEDFLHDLLRERGYTTEMVAMKETVYHRPPEPDQVAAYDKAILRAVLDEDEAALERMRAAGRRMDACNRFGDSILHMACRRGRAAALRFLLRAAGSAGVVSSDDFGRTVMHDACWTSSPRFDVASAVLDADTRLLRTLDSRGSSPLQYVPEDQWPLWCAFFESRKEVYWPKLPPGAEDVAGIIPVTEEVS